MPPRPRRFTSWSWTRFYDYDACPHQAAAKHLDKMQQPKSPALERGATIHTLAEQYVKGTLAKLPSELKPVAERMKELRKAFADRIKSGLTVLVEENWGFTKDWEPCRWDDWANCWLRIKVDVALFLEPGWAHIVDHKSGKHRAEKHQEYLLQMSLYNTGALAYFPEAAKVTSSLLYTDLGAEIPSGAPVARGDFKALRRDWDKRVKPMFNDQRFDPKPGDHCRWCIVTSCKFNAGFGGKRNA